MSQSIDLGGLQPTAFGPLLPLIEDEDVVEIMVAGPRSVTVQRRTGERARVDAAFTDAPDLDRAIEAITRPLLSGDEQPAIRKGQISSSLSVTAIMRPASVGGSTLNIKKLSARMLDRQELLDAGMFSPYALEYLRACVFARMNIIIAGGARTGKTTLLNELASFIPDEERIVAIENGLTLHLSQPDVVHLMPGDEVSMQDLVRAAFGLSADRILLDELRSAEAYDFVQGLNLDIGGAIATLHGPEIKESLSRLEIKMRMGEPHAPEFAIRQMIASGVHVIVQLRRDGSGTRLVDRITEVRAADAEGYDLADIFEYIPEHRLDGDRVAGALKPTGLRPKYYDMIEEAGIVLPPTTFSVPPRPE